MFNMSRRLTEMDMEGRPLNIGIVGSGKMGCGLVSQMAKIRGMYPSVLISRRPEKGIEAFRKAGIDSGRIVQTNSLEKIDLALEKGDYVVAEYTDLVGSIDRLDAIVDGTGDPEAGANIALDALESNKHIIMLNVEADSLVGPILYEKAREKGLIYTGSSGDEPGAVMELYNFAEGLGFDILAVGKGKNNPIDHYIRPKDLLEEAELKGLKPSMLAGFIDGTNTMVEMTAMANATGFLPDIRGGHGVKSDLDSLTKILSLKEDGGVLNRYKIVDYVFGIAPGVFLIFTTDSRELREQLAYSGMGEGPNYLLYRPYHLTSMETPLSIYNACVNKTASIAPVKGQMADPIARAKRDLKKGDYLDHIGGETFYGSIERHDIVLDKGYLPVGLINSKTRVKVDIRKDEYITRDMVELDRDRTIYRLREEQEKMFMGI